MNYEDIVNKKYSFDIEIAKEVGVEEAIMLSNIEFWCMASWSRKKKSSFHDGRYWTYNSREAFSKVFPFWSVQQIKRIIKNLVNAGYLIKDNFNKKKYDNTSWYTSTRLVEMNQSLGSNEPVEGVQMNQPIPDNKPDSKTDSNKEEEEVETPTPSSSKSKKELPMLSLKLPIEMRKQKLRSDLAPFLEKYGPDMLNDFYGYWTQMTEYKRKSMMMFEKAFKERGFSVGHRLGTWKRNQGKWDNDEKPKGFFGTNPDNTLLT